MGCVDIALGTVEFHYVHKEGRYRRITLYVVGPFHFHMGGWDPGIHGCSLKILKGAELNTYILHASLPTR